MSEENQKLNADQAGAFMKGMLFGLVLGAAGGVLLAPKSGKETRDDLRKKILSAQKALGEQAGKFSSYVKENSEEIADKIKRAQKELKK